MDHEFWLERWRTNQIGFHQAEFNARLMRHWPTLGLAKDARVLVPLCGKSRDMLWLAGAGHVVTGVELSSTAVEAFFAEAGAPHSRRQSGSFTFYDGGRIGIYCGDFFALTEREVAGTAGVFDRAALIALPPPMRRRYAEHLLNILPIGAQSLLVTIEYDQDRASGPPFSVQSQEVADLFGLRCSVELLERSPTQEMPPRFHAQGIREAGESTYRIIKER